MITALGFFGWFMFFAILLLVAIVIIDKSSGLD